MLKRGSCGVAEGARKGGQVPPVSIIDMKNWSHVCEISNFVDVKSYHAKSEMEQSTSDSKLVFHLGPLNCTMCRPTHA